LLALGRQEEGFPGRGIAFLLWVLIAALLMLQPDFGQTALVTAIFGVQLFLAGLSWYLVIGLAVVVAGGLVAGYLTLPHVALPTDTYFHSEASYGYQIGRSMEAFMTGGWWGRRPGEATVKAFLPDAHSDFLFAVAGEKLGTLACLLIVML